jgi:hypothetical protein
MLLKRFYAENAGIPLISFLRMKGTVSISTLFHQELTLTVYDAR